ncbi:unannotated protein [freshwater metagenome]|uniref:Unannotated protein n=1 Tax=freshwater metagenome TaxID=449393 RepID=A0A6J6BYY2_9ZZZZ
MAGPLTEFIATAFEPSRQSRLIGLSIEELVIAEHVTTCPEIFSVECAQPVSIKIATTITSFFIENPYRS